MDEGTVVTGSRAMMEAAQRLVNKRSLADAAKRRERRLNLEAKFDAMITPVEFMDSLGNGLTLLPVYVVSVVGANKASVAKRINKTPVTWIKTVDGDSHEIELPYEEVKAILGWVPKVPNKREASDE